MKFPIELTEESDLHKHSLNEMSQIGNCSGMLVYIYAGEGPIPHFHLIKGNPESPSWETCIKITEASYFQHGSKKMKLNVKERKHLVEFLRQPDQDEPSLTNWQSLILAWNKNNPENKLNCTMPNYEELKN